MMKHNHHHRMPCWLTVGGMVILVLIGGCGKQSQPSTARRSGQSQTKMPDNSDRPNNSRMNQMGDGRMMQGRGMMSDNEHMRGMVGGQKQAANQPAANKAGWEGYKRENCAACHAINGKGGNVGPDLTHEGKTRTHAWIEKQITDPKAHFPKTTMPAYKLSQKDLTALAAYIASLK